MLLVHILTAAFLSNVVQTIHVTHHQIRSIERKMIDDASMREITDFLNNPEVYKVARRASNANKLAKTRQLYRILRDTVNRGDNRPLLRHGVDNKKRNKSKSGDEYATIVENELKNSLSQKLSALYDRPYVEEVGKKDFLVLRPDVIDPYVTVIPNAIYYNIEKKCVNWLDDCSLKGIRARLLRGVNSPYK